MDRLSRCSSAALPLPASERNGCAMAGSEPGVSAAMSSRGARFAGAPSGYRFLLPSIPSEDSMRACLILHCDLGGRPYRIDDFRTPFLLLGVLKDIAGIGPFQMGHVWLIKLKTPEARQRLLDSGGLQVKGRYCAVIDPIQQEVTVKVHWVPFHVADAALARVFADFGEVKDVRQDAWGAAGFEAAESTTRLVRMMLHEDLTPDDLPHMLRFYGGSILVVVPGRAPQCLRCRRTGHIRKDCRTPRCSKCKTFGHLAEDCVRTYANVTSNPEEAEVPPEVMDDEEAELAASAPTGPTKPPAKEADETAGGNAPLKAPPNTKGVAINEEAGARKAIHGEGNGTEEETQGNHSTQKLLDSDDEHDQATPRATTSTATQQSDGSPAEAATGGDDSNKAQATTAAAAAKRPRESPGLNVDQRLKQLEREWSLVASKNKKSKVPAQQNRSASASRPFRP